MEKVLALSAVSEAAFGLILLVHPPIVVRLLFNAEIAGTGMVMSRVAGISLIAMGVACLPRFDRGWPGSNEGSRPVRALLAMLCYSLLVTLYLTYLGISGELVGALLWPAVVVHAILTFFLGGKWLKD